MLFHSLTLDRQQKKVKMLHWHACGPKLRLLLENSVYFTNVCNVNLCNVNELRGFVVVCAMSEEYVCSAQCTDDLLIAVVLMFRSYDAATLVSTQRAVRRAHSCTCSCAVTSSSASGRASHGLTCR